MTFRARGLYASSSKESRRFRWGPWMLLGGVLVVVLVVLTGVSVLGNVVAHQSDKTDSYGGVSTLNVNNHTGGHIEVGAAEGDEIVVERTLRGGPLSEPIERIDEGGDSLDVDGRCGGFPLFSTCSIDYTIQVPEDVTVTLENNSGNVEVRELASELSVNSVSGAIEVFDHEGSVDAEATSGMISLSDVTGSVQAHNVSGDIEATGEGERLEASTTSGSVDVEDFTAEEVVAESVSGSLELGGGFTTLEAETTSGGVEVTTDTPFELMEVETVSGGVEARVPAGTYEIGGESTSGDREFDVDTASEADSRIEVNTTSGSVRVGH